MPAQTNPESGYPAAPALTAPGYSALKVKTTVEFDPDLNRNGGVVSLETVEGPWFPQPGIELTGKRGALDSARGCHRRPNHTSLMINGAAQIIHRRLFPAVAGLVTAASMAAQSPIVDDGSLGLNGGALSVNATTVTIPDTLGATMGNNLFHSFTQFGVPAGVTAKFNGPATIQNVIARVSGTAASQIDGTIDTKSAMANANFFLMNPNGISFGSGAALNVGGSVLFTTADEIGFTDGKAFPATIPVSDDLSSVTANRFGFLSQTPGDITFGGSKLHIRETHFPDVPGAAPGVRFDAAQAAKPRQSLTAIAGDVTLPSGTEISSTALNLIAVGDRPAAAPAGPRNINVDPADYLSKPTGEAFGSVAITLGEHYLDGEVIRVMGGNVSIVDSDIYAYGMDGTGFGLSIDTPGTISAVDSIISVYAGMGGLELNAQDIRLIRGRRNAPYIEASTLAYFQGGSPRAGDVVLKAADSITIEGYSVFSNTTDDHASGNVIVAAGGALQVSESKSGVSDIGEISTIGVNTQVPTSGPDVQIGDVTVTARTIEVSGAANISSASFYANDTSGTIPVPNNLNSLPLAKAGNVTVTAEESILIDGQNPTALDPLFDARGIFSQFPSVGDRDLGNFFTHPTSGSLMGEGIGDAGNITVRVNGPGVLSVINGGLISSSSGLSKAAFAAALTGTFAGGFQGESDPGNVTISARFITLDSGNSDKQLPSGIFAASSRINPNTTGVTLGNVTINDAQEIVVRNGARITTVSYFDLAGDIRLQNFQPNALVRLDGGTVESVSGAISGFFSDTLSGLGFPVSPSTTVVNSAGGDGGDIIIDGPRTLLLLNSTIDASTTGTGASGGNITLNSEVFLRQNSIVSASSKSGVSGNVAGADLPINLSDVVTPVQAVPVGDSLTLPEQNAVFRSSDVSGQTVAGRGRRPVVPQRYELSFEAESERERK